jgi:glutamate--cysteine ligase
VQYVEVRLMDLDPFEPIGISSQTVRFLDVFLLHCLLTDSPPDTPEEINQLGRNQQLVAQRGREPGLLLERSGASSPITLTDWGLSLIPSLLEVARTLDQYSSSTCHTQAVEHAKEMLLNPNQLTSARVLQAVTEQFDGSFVAFVRHQSQLTMQALLEMPWNDDLRKHFESLAQESYQEQQRIEASDSLPFDIYLQQYLSPQRLSARRVTMV